MSQIKVYEYEKCSTCRNALKFLDKNDVEYKRISIVDQPPTTAELKRMLAFYDGEIKKLFNTSGQLYRELGISEKLKAMSTDEAITLLSKNGKLVKRPLISADFGIVGFKEDQWKKLRL